MSSIYFTDAKLTGTTYRLRRVQRRKIDYAAYRRRARRDSAGHSANGRVRESLWRGSSGSISEVGGTPSWVCCRRLRDHSSSLDYVQVLINSTNIEIE